MRRVSPSAADADQRHPCPLPDHQPQHIAVFRAQGHEHSDFVSAPADQLQDHAADSDAGQHQRCRHNRCATDSKD